VHVVLISSVVVSSLTLRGGLLCAGALPRIPGFSLVDGHLCCVQILSKSAQGGDK
jgi:hypothetical protein